MYLSGVDTDLHEKYLLQFEGNTASAFIVGMVSDSIGNVYIYGNCSNEITYSNKQVPRGVFLAKHDPARNLLWICSIANAEATTDIGEKMAMDPTHEFIYLTGTFYEEISIPGGGTLAPEGQGSIFVMKFDGEGHFIWLQRIEN